MDPKEYAARLQRMQDEIETAKAREQISNGYNKAMETSPMVDTTERLYAEFKAAKKPKAKKSASKAPATAVAAPGKSPVKKPWDYREPRMSSHEIEQMRVDAEYANGIQQKDMYGNPAGTVPVPSQLATKLGGLVTSAKKKVDMEARSLRPPAPTINAVRGTVKPPPPPAEKKTSPQERIKGISAAQAEAILSDIYSTRGKHGQYAPDEMELIEALKGRASGFDYSKAKQAPAAPYVPSFLGGKK